MKHITNLPWLIVSIIFLSTSAIAQTTEDFEGDIIGATNFNDNGQNFTITNGPGETNYDIETFSGGGWNGTAPDNNFVDNSGLPTPTLGNGTSFTISTTNGTDIFVNHLYLFISQFNLTAATGFTLTIQGRKNGVLQYTIVKTSGFSNTSTFTPNNGFTFINFATEGGSDNSNTAVDELIFSTTGNADYVALDGMNWEFVPCANPTVPTLSASPTTVCSGGSSTLSITGTLNDATQWAVYTGSCGGTLLGTTTTSSFVVSPTATTAYFVRGEGGCVTSGSCSVITVNVSTLNQTVASQTNIACNGGSNGAASVTATGGAGGYSYNWTPGNPVGDGTPSVTGLTAGMWTCTVTDANLCTKAVNVTITQPTTITSSISAQTNVACNGGTTGSATVSAAGGTPGYSYSWSPSGGTAATATGLAAGTYTCTITDANGCTKTQSATITQPTAITSSVVSQTNVSCNSGSDGAATIAASGGTPGYTYSWSPSGGTAATITGRTAGTYTCTITDANGCTKTQAVTITQPSAITSSVSSQTNVACNAGSTGAATIVASGGTPGYTYSWSPSGGTAATITGRTAGTYTCTITDANGCTKTQAVTITQPSAIAMTLLSSLNPTCGSANGSATMNAASGGTPGYTYNWTPGNPSGDGTTAVTGLTTGTWTCTVTDLNGCVKATTVTLTSSDVTPPTAVCQNFTAFLNASGTATITAANINNGSSDNCGAVTLSASQTVFTCANVGPNNVTLTVTDGSGNTATCIAVVTVVDNLAPSVSCPGNQTEVASANCDFILPNYTGLASGTDNCSGSITYTQSPVAGTTITADQLVTITGTDANGNTQTCSFNVLLNFSACQGAECTNAITLAPLDPCGDQTTETGSTVGGTTSTQTSFCGTSSGSGGANWYTFTGDGGTWTASTLNSGTNYDSKLWVYEGLCSALNCVTGNDDFGGTAQSQVSFVTTVGATYYIVVGGYQANEGNYVLTVSNVEGIAPVADLATLPDVTAECEVTSLTAPTATDNCAATLIVTNNASLPITAQGTTVVTWTYDDGNGNTSTQTQNVILTDVTAPVPDAATLADVTADCEVTSLVPPTATDGCSGTVTVTNDAILPISGQGSSVITWTYEDANGNSTTQTQNVVIQDVSGPTPDVPVLSAINAVCEVTSLSDPGAVDNCSGLVTVTNDATLPISAQGTTVVTWTYTDIYGNSTTQTQDVVISDVTDPVPDSTSLEDVSSSCAVTLDAPTAMDNCAGVITATTTTAFPITANGTSIVVWEFNDGNGNVVTQNQTVNIAGVDVSVSLASNGVTITASNPGGPGISFNWLDCNAAFGAIPGASSPTYTSLVNGSYAVRISENGCADTSVCIVINSADLTPLLLDQLTLYPNPSNDGYFTVNYDGIIEAIDVVDMLGRIIELPTDLQNGLVDGSTLNAGRYMVRVRTNQTVLISEIVIAQ